MKSSIVVSGFIVLAVVLWPGVSYGQGKLPQVAVQAAKKASAGGVKKAAVLSPGAREMHALRESPLFNRITPTKQEDLRVFFPELEPIQQKALSARYYQVMDEFVAFKRDLDVRLFYQTLPGEARPFLPLEREELFKQLGSLSVRIRALKAGPFRKDPAAEAALDYLNEAAGRIDPTFKNMFGAKEWPRGNRQYNDREFFLQSPPRFGWLAPAKAGEGALFAFSRCKKIMEKLPVRRVAVLNDDAGLLAILQRWQKRGGFGSGAEWSFYSNARSLQRELKLGKKFDLILTDVLVPGGGGPLIAAQLRQNSIPTPIIALTQYEDSPATALWLYSAGMDGMITVDSFFGARDGDMLFLAQKLQNYFYYRDLHHWTY